MRLLAIRSVKHLYMRLGLNGEFLHKLARDAEKLARDFDQVRKGKRRHFEDPNQRLRLVQSRIKGRLLDPLPLPDSVHGYRSARSQLTALGPHLGSRFLLSADIKDFYPSIKHKRVYALWQSLGCVPDVARLLTRLTTRRGGLPHGYITSPAIANLVRLPLDRRLEGLARAERLVYTNFSDHLFLSGKRIRPHVCGLCRKIADEFGWELHDVEVRGPNDEKRALGLVISNGVDVPPEYYAKVQGQIRRFVHAEIPRTKEWRSLRGRIAYVRMVNPQGAGRLESMLSHPPIV